MKFAIIAAGEGSRLAMEGIEEPKPLIKIQGVPIIERLVKIFAKNRVFAAEYRTRKARFDKTNDCCF